jgi:hypothetical protein
MSKDEVDFTNDPIVTRARRSGVRGGLADALDKLAGKARPDVDAAIRKQAAKDGAKRALQNPNAKVVVALPATAEKMLREEPAAKSKSPTTPATGSGSESVDADGVSDEKQRSLNSAPAVHLGGP